MNKLIAMRSFKCFNRAARFDLNNNCFNRCSQFSFYSSSQLVFSFNSNDSNSLNHSIQLFNSIKRRSSQKVNHKLSQFNENQSNQLNENQLNENQLNENQLNVNPLNENQLDKLIANQQNQLKIQKQIKSIEMQDFTIPNYSEAIATLNSLQSNRWEIQKRIIDPSTLEAKLERTKAYLDYLTVNQNDLNSMNIIHVSGTKGKGSTCAFIESILRKKGFKTGLFVSPHLISVRERIQLDGKPIEKSLFAKNFFHVYNQLKAFNNLDEKVDEIENALPFYFNFLTLMALYTFKQQGCNATILEVGIGGEFDCTNIVDRPAVVGVSSLGIDHVKLLGSTLKEIAWHKSGIFKQNVPAFTSNNQKIEALSVLLERAEERDCPIKICPPLEDYQIEENRILKLGINGDVQKLNASLALQICNYFINKMTNGDLNGNQSANQIYANDFKLDNDYLDAIEECKWSGRFEVIPLKNKSTFYLDGAHTIESLTHCINWFKNECLNEQISNKKLFKILIFNCTGYRDYNQLLSAILKNEKFDLICFTTNLKTVEDLNNTKSDVFCAVEDESNRDQFKEQVLKDLNFTGTVRHFDCLENCLKDISAKNEVNLINNLQTKVLATGSIHLIGGIISLLNERYS